jgi:hypothetical protein
MSKRSYTETTKTIIKAFKKEQTNPELKKTKDCVYREILQECNKLLLNVLVEDGKVCLGDKLGFLEVLKYKKKYMNIDFNKTKIEGRKIYNFNSHLDGYDYRIYWNKYSKSSLADKFMWRVKLTREFRRNVLGRAIHEKRVDYPIKLYKSKNK